MPVYIDHDAVGHALTWDVCMDLLEEASRHEASGEAFVSQKFNSDFRGGSIRILFAADYVANRGALKAYHTIEGVGTRYLVSLIDLTSGALLALVDGRQITDFRTGAVSGVIARRVPFGAPVSLGVLGSGHQARAQFGTFAAACKLERAFVYSPTPENRSAFAREMSELYRIPVEPVDSAERAVQGRDVVVAASKSRSAEPVLRREWLGQCRLLCAVGNTRPQFLEMDPHICEDARIVIVDSLHAFSEAGELIQAAAAGYLPPTKRSTLHAVVADPQVIPKQGLVVFKSVGTALQDLALASHCYEVARNGEGGSPVVPDLHCSG